MSYAGLGVAIPAFRGGALAARSVPALRASRGWGRGIGGYSGSLGASAAATSGGSGASPTVMQTATAALAAVKASSTDQLRSPIAAVRTFQAAHGGLSVDGIYGSNTRRALMQVLGRGESDLPPVPSGGSSSSSSSSSYSPSVATDVMAVPMTDPSALTLPSSESWLVPVAVVSSVVLVAGGLIYMQRRRKGGSAPAAASISPKKASRRR